ncbi:hypothetical protein ACS7SF_00085 [Ralstonia sp. 25C]|uniref:hypothetical protein n=1 Tax=Ralstonia sp. 25C TaxID=3447363 RepID=UPI003F74DD0E
MKNFFTFYLNIKKIMMSETSKISAITAKRNARQLSIFIIVVLVIVFHAAFYESNGDSGHAVRQFGAFLVSLFKKLGLLSSSIGLTGGSPPNLYLQQIAIALSGAFLFGVYLVGSVISSGVPLSTGYEKNEQKMMERYGINRKSAAILQRLILIAVSGSVIFVCGFFVGAAVFGWFVVNIGSVLILVFFSVCFVFFPGCAVITLLLAMVEYLSRDLTKFFHRII